MNYLRTSWVVDTFDEFTVRTRLIARVSDEDPIEVRFKIVSERARGQVVLEMMNNLDHGREL